MRKLLSLLFPALAAFAILGCSNNDDMPCATCDSRGGSTSQGSGSQPVSYAYCLYYGSGGYSCSYMSVYDCNYDYGGWIYSEPTCGGYAYVSPSSSSRPGSSSSYRSSSSSRQSVVVYGNPVYYEGETYETVVIGSQTWMARNLNYDPGTGNSGCYNNDPSRCATYGRLYDWSTAMGIDSRYNYEYWNGSDARHQGICPSGWHIPSNADWDRLYRYADGTSGTSSPYDSPTAGRYLKATSGWNSGGNGEDTFGFSALPGGYGSSGGDFDYVGYYGHWWSAGEYYSSGAYSVNVGYYNEYARWYYSSKDDLFSVRCVQD